MRLFIDAVILAVIQQRNLIDHSAKMNLLAYSSGKYLDHLGALLGVYRLAPAHAVTTMRAALSEALSTPAVIPAGTRFQAGKFTFAAVNETLIPAGTLSADFEAQCTVSGSEANGLAAGQISRLIDVLPFSVSFENLSETSGGTDQESDEAFRERIQIAPESFSVAGPVKAYEYFARSANSDIIDVAVIGPPVTQPGVVKIYPLMTDGTLPSDEVLAEVLATCSAEDVRPDTDYVEALRPSVVDYNLSLTYWIDEANAGGAAYARESIESAIDGWILWQRKSLGRDLNPSELIHRVIDAGAKRCEVASPGFRVLKDWEVAMCVNRSVDYGGLERA